MDLTTFETRQDGGMSKDEGEKMIAELGRELDDLEDLLYYAGQHSVLVVLQGRDTAGKDGAIRTILRYVNGQSCRVAPFKVPTAEELSHDFLWRVHSQVPGKGSMTLFNRSHYEDVLVVRVHGLVPKDVWEKRYDQINSFEQLLADHGTIVVKLLLAISKEEQEERLLARELEVEKSWKLSVGDWKERDLWDDYTAAYQDVIDRCSPKIAPWYVIPADRKWYRDLVILRTLVEAIKPYRTQWIESLRELGIQRKNELEAYRSSK